MSDIQLSKHFKLSEFTRSTEAQKRGLDNTPGEWHLTNLVNLANTLESVRQLLGNVPIIISSGYRSPAVNKTIGGSGTSDHVNGLAADFMAKGFTVRQVVEKIAESGIKFDQLIKEPSWVHIGIGQGMRQQVLTKVGNKYPAGIIGD